MRPVERYTLHTDSLTHFTLIKCATARSRWCLCK